MNKFNLTDNKFADFGKRENCAPHSGRKPTSFNLFDQEMIFNEIDIKEGCSFLDLGCGIGEYSIHASDLIGASGLIYAIDIRQDAIESLEENIKSRGLKNIKTIVANITETLPLNDSSVDVCLISTVLHALGFKENSKTLFYEIFRVLRPGGRLITIDCKKEEAGFGPPMYMRISPEELEEEILKYKFKNIKFIDLGYFYMYQFLKEEQ